MHGSYRCTPFLTVLAAYLALQSQGIAQEKTRVIDLNAAAITLMTSATIYEVKGSSQRGRVFEFGHSDKVYFQPCNKTEKQERARADLLPSSMPCPRATGVRPLPYASGSFLFQLDGASVLQATDIDPFNWPANLPADQLPATFDKNLLKPVSCDSLPASFKAAISQTPNQSKAFKKFEATTDGGAKVTDMVQAAGGNSYAVKSGDIGPCNGNVILKAFPLEHQASFGLDRNTPLYGLVIEELKN